MHKDLCIVADVKHLQYIGKDADNCMIDKADLSPTCCSLSTPPYKQSDDRPKSFFRGLAAACICCASSLWMTDQSETKR